MSRRILFVLGGALLVLAPLLRAQTDLDAFMQFHGLQAQIFGPREFQEALNNFVQPANLAFYDGDVLERALDGGRQR